MAGNMGSDTGSSAGNSGAIARTAWDRFRGSRLWRTLRRLAPLRTLVYLSIEVYRVLREGYTNAAVWDSMYALADGRWSYETNPQEQEYFAQLAALLDAAGKGRFGRALEVGTGDGNFTAVLAPRCEMLLSADVAPNALARAHERQAWPPSVTFTRWDVRRDAVPRSFDLIVVACVLESVHRPWLLTRIRDKLVAALEPGGHLLVATTRHAVIVEESWWGRRLLRGRWIAAHFAVHPAVTLVEERLSDLYAFALVRRNGGEPGAS